MLIKLDSDVLRVFSESSSLEEVSDKSESKLESLADVSFKLRSEEKVSSCFYEYYDLTWPIVGANNTMRMFFCFFPRLNQKILSKGIFFLCLL